MYKNLFSKFISGGKHGAKWLASSNSAHATRVGGWGHSRGLATTQVQANLAKYSEFKELAVTSPSERVLHVELNRPEVRNAFSNTMFAEIKSCFEQIGDDKHYRVVVLSGSGKMFCSGIDLMGFQGLLQLTDAPDIARKALNFQSMITRIQNVIYAVYRCRKPIISAVHGGCVGGGIDLISATDIRYCSQDAWFQIKEIDIGMAADIGTIQFLPKIVGNESVVRELIFTGRKMDSTEAKELGLVGKVLPDHESVKQAAFDVAKEIAAKSPVAVQGAKVCLEYSRDHGVWDSLRNMANFNMSMLQTDDITKAGMAVMTKSKDPPKFEDL